MAVAVSPQKRELDWYEASIDESRDLVIMVRPRALAEDPMYGPILRRAAQIAAANVRSIRAGSTMLEAFEAADDLVVAVRGDAENSALKRARELDAVIVVGGVPSGIDPAKLVDSEGKPLWRVLSEKNPHIIELLPVETSAAGRLFILPDRTWVIGVGEGAFRVGAALSRSESTAYLPEPRPPFMVKLRGESLERIRARTRSALAPLTDRLLGVNLALTSGGEGEIRATFAYSDDQAATHAELRGREVIDLLAEKLAPRLDFMKTAEIKRSRASLELRAKLPAALLKRFAEADDAAL